MAFYQQAMLRVQDALPSANYRAFWDDETLEVCDQRALVCVRPFGQKVMRIVMAGATCVLFEHLTFNPPPPQIGGRIRPTSPICSADLLGF